MEVDCIGESRLVAEPSATNLDRFYPAIDTFCRAIAYLQDNRVQYSPKVFLDGLGNFLDRIQATAYRPGLKWLDYPGHTTSSNLGD